jgi:hypothetical protein
VAPGDEANALRRVVRGLTKLRHRVGRDQHRLENDFYRNRGCRAKSFGNFLRMFGDLLQRFRTIKMLAAGDEPDFKLFKIDVQAR